MQFLTHHYRSFSSQTHFIYKENYVEGGKSTSFAEKIAERFNVEVTDPKDGFQTRRNLLKLIVDTQKFPPQNALNWKSKEDPYRVTTKDTGILQILKDNFGAQSWLTQDGYIDLAYSHLYRAVKSLGGEAGQIFDVNFIEEGDGIYLKDGMLNVIHKNPKYGSYEVELFPWNGVAPVEPPAPAIAPLSKPAPKPAPKPASKPASKPAEAPKPDAAVAPAPVPAPAPVEVAKPEPAAEVVEKKEGELANWNETHDIKVKNITLLPGQTYDEAKVKLQTKKDGECEKILKKLQEKGITTQSYSFTVAPDSQWTKTNGFVSQINGETYYVINPFISRGTAAEGIEKAINK